MNQNNFEVKSKGDVLTLVFPDCCDTAECGATPTLDGSLSFGYGGWDFDKGVWEHPCQVCNDAWRNQHRYLFDLILLVHMFLIQDRMGRFESVSFDQEQILKIQKTTKMITFLIPFENMIKGVVTSIIGVGSFCFDVSDFISSYKNKMPDGKKLLNK